jgi:hypothetical protein
MRFFSSGPRILGIRPGISFGLNELLRLATNPMQNKPGEPMTGSFLYAIRGDHNMVKIGVSTNPNARLASLRTASAFPIDFSYIAVTPGTGFDIEAGAHEMLKSHRCNGEWFDVTPEMAVAAIAGAAHKLGEHKYLFDGQPWWLRLPLQIVGGAICGGIIYAALALVYFIAASPGSSSNSGSR